MTVLDDVRRRVGVAARRARLRVRPDAREVSADAAVADLSGEPYVLFLCYGNVCRSPFAERYARTRLADADVSATVDSAGFFDATGRSSPEHAVTAAGDHGVDLGDHGSKPVTWKLLFRADVVFLMDARNDHLLRRQFPDAVSKSYYLKPLGSSDGFEIADPYDSDVDEFRRVYAEVADAVDGLVAGLAEQRSDATAD